MFQSLQIDEEEYTDEYTLFVKDIDLNHNQKMFNTKMDNDPIEKMGFAEFYILNTTINPTTTDKTTISTEVTTSDDSNLAMTEGYVILGVLGGFSFAMVMSGFVIICCLKFKPTVVSKNINEFEMNRLMKNYNRIEA